MTAAIAITFLVTATIFVYYTAYFSKSPAAAEVKSVSSFDECVAAKYPVSMTAYPEECTTPAGQKFTADIGNANTLTSEIKMIRPTANQMVKSPLSIDGQAVGTWFSEGVLSVRVEDKNGQVLGQTNIKVDNVAGNEFFTSFSGSLSFSSGSSEKGNLVVSKGSSDTTLHFPVKFK